MHYLKPNECMGLKPKQFWFKGKILAVFESKYGKYFKIFLREYLGEDVSAKNMLGVISIKYFRDFDEDENFLEQNVEFILQSSYIGKGPLNLTVRLVK